MCRGGGLPLTNNNPFQQQNHTTPYVFVFHNNSTIPKYCNSALYSENKRSVLLKKKIAKKLRPGVEPKRTKDRHKREYSPMVLTGLR